MPHRFDLGPSAYLSVLLLALHVVVIGAIMTADLPLWLVFLLCTCMIVQCVRLLRRYALRTTPISIRSLYFDEAGWVLEEQSGRKHAVKMADDSVVWMHCVALMFRSGWRRWRVMILADAMSRDDFRRLRVLLMHAHVGG